VKRIEVGGDQPYEVILGSHVTPELKDLVQGAARAAVIFTKSVQHDASHAVQDLIEAGLVVTPMEVPDAEAAKTVKIATRCWDALAANGFTRSDVIVGVGGGALTDLAGFVAATWLRGVRWIPVATSINGMVDAAVGGKTGYQHRRRQEPRRRLPPARGCAVRAVRVEDAATGTAERGTGRGRQVRLHRRPPDS
jgi:3-dehydroquinate synthase